ncbi:polysaccharide deacetylase [Chitinivibrio alkaliphilus ACht1]|uniref:Polysaccharide deacetylase n=1 Tax=Chitinivibrio alkaliphilus ACht1 TaxID=1313304 RepID=U7D522_9BACT|nr:polysaccharide deacetylase [Chitinivibrio alkaliphilus]ERP30666.1 polysaccharide deacetylase [Chitinivibrio alkaliphilus ACht1]
MESNSPLPYKAGEPISALPGEGGQAFKDGFGLWGGEGRGTQNIDTLPWGQITNQAEQFGQREGNIWQYMGWRIQAGRYISKEAWAGAIELGERELDVHLGLSVPQGNLHAFRAPRLEVNSNLYYALAEAGYQYDCGLEEGYEQHRDGTNFLWPYTMDNGSPNVSYQRLIGVNVHIDSTPQGLWQIPVNTFIVPEEYRQEVWNNRTKINDAALDGGDMGTFESWSQAGGKITGFDFNMYIMWGMTKEIWLETMKNTTNLRLEGNKAPIQYGAHTDYYTPIYDNATLLNDVNAPSYGLNVTEGWNTWEDRITSLEKYLDWAINQKGCYVVSGHRLIEEIKAMEQNRAIGKEEQLEVTWEFFRNEELNSSANQDSFTGDIIDAEISVDADGDGDNVEYTGYRYYTSPGSFADLDHLSFDYQTTAPLAIRLATQSGDAREVIIGHVGGSSLRNSGKIPLTAFEQNQYAGISGFQWDPIDTEDITGIEIEVLTDGLEAQDHSLTVQNFALFKGAETSIIAENGQNNLQDMTVHSFVDGRLSLGVSQEGNYNIALVNAAGRTLQTMEGQRLKRGVNALSFDGVARGIYFVRISNDYAQKTVRALAL